MEGVVHDPGRVASLKLSMPSKDAKRQVCGQRTQRHRRLS